MDFNPFANPFDVSGSGEEELLQKKQLSPESCTGSNCGDALANYMNIGPLKGTGYSLPSGGIGPGDLSSVGKSIGSAVYNKNNLSLETLTPGTVIHMTRQPGDKNYEYGNTHIGIVDNDENGQPVFKSFTAGKGWRKQPINQKFIEELPVQITAANLIPGPRVVGGKEQQIFAKLKNPGKSGPKPFKEYQVASAGNEITGPPIIEDPFANPAESGEPFAQPEQVDPFNKPEQVVSEQEEQPEPESTGLPEADFANMDLSNFKKEIKPTVRTALEMGGMLGGGTLGAAGGLATGPASPAAVPTLTAAGEMGGYYIGKKAADYFFGRERGGLANTILGKIGETPAAKEMEDIREAGLYAMGFPAATAFGKRGIEIGADVYAALASKMSSVAKDVVKTVVDGAKSGRPWVDMGLTGRMSGRDVTDLAVANFEKINAEASADYAAGANKIVEKYGQDYLIPRPTDKPINKSLFQRIRDDILTSKGFGKGGYVPKKPDGSLDWSSSSFGVSEENRGLAKQAMEKILEYDKKPRTLENLHNLKNFLDGLWKQSSDDTVKGFLTKATNEIKHDISFKIPEYKELSDVYHTVMLQVEDINKKIIPKTTELTKKEWVADQVLNKLTSLMRKEESPIARDIAKRLLGVQGYEALAGHMFTPEIGKLGARGAAIELGAATLSPHLVPIIAASSPKLQGEFLAAYGRFLAKSEGSFEPAMRAVGYGLTRVGKKKDETAGTE